MNLEDWLRRFKQRQREQHQQGGRDESWEKDGGCCEERQEMDQDERERLRAGSGQGKGMKKGQGKGKGEIDESKDWKSDGVLRKRMG